jgi:plasmid maintenance system antidote protein VapI
VSAALALRFGKALGQSAEYWLNLQIAYDLAQAKKMPGGKLASVRMLPQVAAREKIVETQ